MSDVPTLSKCKSLKEYYDRAGFAEDEATLAQQKRDRAQQDEYDAWADRRDRGLLPRGAKWTPWSSEKATGRSAKKSSVPKTSEEPKNVRALSTRGAKRKAIAFDDGTDNLEETDTERKRTRKTSRISVPTLKRRSPDATSSQKEDAGPQPNSGGVPESKSLIVKLKVPSLFANTSTTATNNTHQKKIRRAYDARSKNWLVQYLRAHTEYHQKSLKNFMWENLTAEFNTQLSESRSWKGLRALCERDEAILEARGLGAKAM